MTFEQSKQTILHLLRTKGRARNNEMLAAIALC